MLVLSQSTANLSGITVGDDLDVRAPGAITANGVNATAFDEKTITLTGTAADLNVTAGDVLALFSDSNGTGIVDPGGLVKVSLARR